MSLWASDPPKQAVIYCSHVALSNYKCNEWKPLYPISYCGVACGLLQRDLDGNVPHAKERVQWDPMLIPKVATFQSNVIVSQQDFVLIFLDRFFQSKAISVQQNHQLSGCGEDLIAYLIN